MQQHIPLPPDRIPLAFFLAMKLKTVLLQGEISDKLSYNIGDVCEITQGLWELNVSQISLKSSTSRKHSYVLKLSTSAVKDNICKPDSTTYFGPMPLCMVKLKESWGTGLYDQKEKFFEINSPSRVLELLFENVNHDEDLPANVIATVLLVIRRKA